MGKALLDWRLLGAGLLREAPRQARLCLESAANQKPSRQPRQVAQQSVTVCSTFLTTDERHQIWLFILRRAVERPTCNDGLRDRPRHRTSNWSRNSFPNWSWLKPTSSSQNFGIKKELVMASSFFMYTAEIGLRVQTFTWSFFLQSHFLHSLRSIGFDFKSVSKD